MGSVGKKKGKRKSLLNLRGALKGLLTAQNSNNSSVEPPVLSTTNLEEDLSDTSKQTETSEFSSNPQHLQPQDKHGIVYIMSKEAQLIPKLTDEQVLERHKRADENMKRAWSRLIQKYESIGDEGDVLDLNTGEIIEDNGHIRGLSTFDATVNSANDNYVSVLSDLLEIDKATGNVWQEDEEEEEEGDFEKEDGSSSESDGANDHDEFAEVGQDL
ncbi:LANO_0E02036g1_1 [Lachancea nothofagi CBS 11611]|uniref:LANO_0E02036g1_1 n=1 Tax=Lachancea nothofagi CBS 11611 TaxID=1266666 RepID=A0A1G4JPS1_9SACH|nr:LANO_0E02036g1_1 [Lachancea nothofagi CBS 11611]